MLTIGELEEALRVSAVSGKNAGVAFEKAISSDKTSVQVAEHEKSGDDFSSELEAAENHDLENSSKNESQVDVFSQDKTYIKFIQKS